MNPSPPICCLPAVCQLPVMTSLLLLYDRHEEKQLLLTHFESPAASDRQEVFLTMGLFTQETKDVHKGCLTEDDIQDLCIALINVVHLKHSYDLQPIQRP